MYMPAGPVLIYLLYIRKKYERLLGVLTKCEWSRKEAETFNPLKT